MTSPSPFRADTAALIRRRGVAMVATLVVHAVLLALILWGQGARPDAAPVAPVLAVFDARVAAPAGADPATAATTRIANGSRRIGGACADLAAKGDYTRA